MKRAMLSLAVAVGLVALPGGALAGSATETYDLVMPPLNVGIAANGDRVVVGGSGTFQVNPKAVEASGTFTHTDAAGTVLGGGTWTATDLIAFQPYGCGVVAFPDPDVILPSNFCGGKLKLRVELTTPGGTFDGILTVFCIIGPNPPNSHEQPIGEGVTLDIAGVINFNHTGGGMNVYVKTS